MAKKTIRLVRGPRAEATAQGHGKVIFCDPNYPEDEWDFFDPKKKPTLSEPWIDHLLCYKDANQYWDLKGAKEIQLVLSTCRLPESYEVKLFNPIYGGGGGWIQVEGKWAEEVYYKGYFVFRSFLRKHEVDKAYVQIRLFD